MITSGTVVSGALPWAWLTDYINYLVLHPCGHASYKLREESWAKELNAHRDCER